MNVSLEQSYTTRAMMCACGPRKLSGPRRRMRINNASAADTVPLPSISNASRPSERPLRVWSLLAAADEMPSAGARAGSAGQ